MSHDNQEKLHFDGASWEDIKHVFQFMEQLFLHAHLVDPNLTTNEQFASFSQSNSISSLGVSENAAVYAL